MTGSNEKKNQTISVEKELQQPIWLFCVVLTTCAVYVYLSLLLMCGGGCTYHPCF